MNTFTACNSRYKHNNSHTKPVEQIARNVTLEYNRKFKKLDQQFVDENVGDGNGGVREGVSGPFESAQQQFYWGQVMLTCAAWFGDIGEDF